MLWKIDVPVLIVPEGWPGVVHTVLKNVGVTHPWNVMAMLPVLLVVYAPVPDELEQLSVVPLEAERLTAPDVIVKPPQTAPPQVSSGSPAEPVAGSAARAKATAVTTARIDLCFICAFRFAWSTRAFDKTVAPKQTASRPTGLWTRKPYPVAAV
jgi:hypothetical protein